MEKRRSNLGKYSRTRCNSNLYIIERGCKQDCGRVLIMGTRNYSASGTPVNNWHGPPLCHHNLWDIGPTVQQTARYYLHFRLIFLPLCLFRLFLAQIIIFYVGCVRRIWFFFFSDDDVTFLFTKRLWETRESVRECFKLVEHLETLRGSNSFVT